MAKMGVMGRMMIGERSNLLIMLLGISGEVRASHAIL